MMQPFFTRHLAWGLSLALVLVPFGASAGNLSAFAKERLSERDTNSAKKTYTPTNSYTDAARFYRDALIIRTNKLTLKPRWEAWPSEVKKRPTQLIVVDFPGLGDSLDDLKMSLDTDFAAIKKQQSARIARLLLMKLGDDTLRLVFEVFQTGRPLSPKVSQIAGKEVIIKLRDNASQASASSSPVEQAIGATPENPHQESQASGANPAPVQPANNDASSQKVKTASPTASAIKKPTTAPVPSTSAEPKADPPKNISAADLKEQQCNQAKFDAARLKIELKKQTEANEKHEQALKDAQAKVNALQKEIALLKNPSSSVASANGAGTFPGVNSTQLNALQDRVNQLAAENKSLQDKLEGTHAFITAPDEALKQGTLSLADQNANLKTALLGVSKKLKQAEDTIAEQNKTIEQLKQSTGQTIPSQPIQTTIGKPPVTQAVTKQEPVVRKTETLPGPIIFKPSVKTPEQRIQALEDEIQRQPGNTDAYFKLGELYQQQHDLNHAERVMNNLLQIEPQNQDAYYELTRIYLGKNEPLKARAVFDTFKRLNPSLPPDSPVYQKIMTELQQSDLPQKSANKASKSQVKQSSVK